MDITFIVIDQQKSHEGVVRPFINFAKVLRNNYEISFLLLNCSDEFSEQIRRSSLQVIESKSKNDAVEKLKSLNPRFLFTDDDLKRLKITLELNKQIKAKTVCYVQILYGSHSIANCFDISYLSLRQKFLFKPIKYIPFSFFSGRYAKLLKKSDLVIANSKVTASLLISLYNVEPFGIIYPSVDTDIFQPTDRKGKAEVTLYLGSHLGDVRRDFVEKIINNIVKKNYAVNLFGNSRVASEITRKANNLIIYHQNITDVELAKMYSRSKLTICPQKWEQFGLVPVESIACGTPVLAFNCMGFQETIGETSGWLANNETDFLQILDSVLESSELPLQELRDSAIREFTVAAGGKAFAELLEKYINEKTLSA